MPIIQHNVTKSQHEQFIIKICAKSFITSAKQIFVAILFLSIILRLISAFYQGNNVTDLPGIYDQISYDELARRVLDGYGFTFEEGHWPATRAGEPTAHWSYLYTVYLVAVYNFFGFYPIIARIIQAIIVGIFSTFFTFRIARRLFGQIVGLNAAALNALYIYFIYYAGGLLTESFYIVCILWSFDATFRIIEAVRKNQLKPLAWKWFELGLAIAITVLLRQVFLLFLPFLFILILWTFRNLQAFASPSKKQVGHITYWPAIKGFSMIVLILALMIIPWTIRNYRAFGTFVLINTNAGFAFYWGNHPIHGRHFVPLQPVSYQDLIPPNLLILNEATLDRALLQEGIRIVINDPVRYIFLSLSRIEEYIKFWPSHNSGLASNLSRVGSFGILLPFMLYGLVRSFSRFRKPLYPGQKANLLIIYLFILVYASIHLLSWTLIRYRLPIDAFLIIFAAMSFEALAQKIGKYNKAKTG